MSHRYRLLTVPTPLAPTRVAYTFLASRSTRRLVMASEPPVVVKSSASAVCRAPHRVDTLLAAKTEPVWVPVSELIGAAAEMALYLPLVRLVEVTTAGST